MPFIVFLIIVVLLISTTIRIVPEACAMVVERLGRFHTVWQENQPKGAGSGLPAPAGYYQG